MKYIKKEITNDKPMSKFPQSAKATFQRLLSVAADGAFEMNQSIIPRGGQLMDL